MIEPIAPTRHARPSKIKNKRKESRITNQDTHDPILVPLLGRGVFAAGFAPASSIVEL